MDNSAELLFHPQHFPQLIGTEPLTLPEIAALPLCLADRTRYFRRYVDGHFREAGLELRVVLETTSVFQLLQGVQVGLGCLISPVGHLIDGMSGELSRRGGDAADVTPGCGDDRRA